MSAATPQSARALPTRISYSLADVIPKADEGRVDWVPRRGRTAILVHDMQEHFVSAYERGAAPIGPVMDSIANLLSWAREWGLPIYYTAQPANQTPEDRALLTDFWGTGLGTSGAPIIPELAPHAGDRVLTKWRYSAFARSDFAEALRAEGCDQLVICGVYAHIGCLTTAVDAFMRDIQPFVLSDAVADFGPDEHRMALRYVASRCGRVMTTAAALDSLAMPAPVPALRAGEGV